jgi:1-phosphofructokinase
MITTVTFNPAIDKTITVPSFTPGAVNRVFSVVETLGGKGINVAKVLQILNTPVTAIGFIGERNYAFVQSLIKQENLLTDFILVDAPTRTNTKIIDPNPKITTDVNEQGFSVNETQVDQMTLLINRYAKRSEIMVFSGSVCKGISPYEFKTLLSLASSITKVVLDADGEMLREGLKASPFLIKPNIHELESLLHTTFNNDRDIVIAVRELLAEHHIRFALISKGEDGSLLISQDLALKAGILPVEPVSTVGAGDSMLAGFISAYLSTNDPRIALQHAACIGSLAVASITTEAIQRVNIPTLSTSIPVTDVTIG